MAMMNLLTTPHRTSVRQELKKGYLITVFLSRNVAVTVASQKWIFSDIGVECLRGRRLERDHEPQPTGARTHLTRCAGDIGRQPCSRPLTMD